MTDEILTAEYRKALEVIREATKTFRKVQLAYRAREIGDEEYLDARAVMKAAEAAFDAEVELVPAQHLLKRK